MRTPRDPFILSAFSLFIILQHLTGCGTRAPLDGARSPKALFEAFHGAIRSHDFEAIILLYDPAHRHVHAKASAAAERYRRRVELAGELIEKRISKRAAETFRRRALASISSTPLERATKNGIIQWDRLRIRIEDDKAHAEMGNEVLCSAIRRPNGMWYMTLSDTESSRAAAAMAQGFIQEGIEHIDQVVKKVKAGVMTEEDFLKPLPKLRAEAKAEERLARSAAIPYGPEVDGVSIRLTPLEPAFRKGEPLRFHLDVKFKTEDPVCFRMNGSSLSGSYGLGEHSLLEIDGKAIEQPRALSTAFCHSGYGMRGGVKTVSLPLNLSLPTGKHTIRLTILSPGGEYVDIYGKQYRVVSGRLVSSTVTFVITE